MSKKTREDIIKAGEIAVKELIGLLRKRLLRAIQSMS
jgi:hypothetical protein